MDATFLCCTYNRAEDLKEMIESALRQEVTAAREYEILVVDNASKDGTRDLVQAWMAREPRIRYFHEPKPGKTHALNLALEHVRGDYFFIADDDLLFPPDYLEQACSAFESHPEWSFVGGRVLPHWRKNPPSWLTNAHFEALALDDRGDQVLETNQDRPYCLLAGCFRTERVRAVGGYKPDVSVAPNQVGGIEDAVLFQKLYQEGDRGAYVPQLRVWHKVEAYRVEKEYHRRWHYDHGRNMARVKHSALETNRYGPFGVPAYMYRQFAEGFGRMVTSRLRGKSEMAFQEEIQLWFLAGFFKERRLRGIPKD
jgi:glucosyl-dolichyl phosphate glucuronosyltransferase